MTDKTDALVARVWEAIGTYSVQVATTGELAPSTALRDAVEALAAPAASVDVEGLRSLSKRLRPGIEAAPWVCQAIARLIDSAGGAKGEPLTESYVQKVPDKCDRITWRGQYLHLPGLTPQPAGGDGAVAPSDAAIGAALRESMAGRGIGYSERKILERAAEIDTRPAATAVVPDAVGEVLAELERATRKFPTWPTDPLHAVAVVGEESGELTKAVLQAVYEPHKSGVGEVRSEAIQTAAMAIRFLQSMDAYAFTKGEQHEQAAAPAAPKGEG